MKILQLSLLAIVITVLSCSKSDPCPHGGEAGDLTFSETTLAKIAYTEIDSVIFIDTEGNQTTGYITRHKIEEREVTGGEPCQVVDTEHASYTYKHQVMKTNIIFPDLHIAVEFMLLYQTRYVSCYFNQHFDELIILRYDGGGSDSRIELQVLLDPYDSTDETVQRHRNDLPILDEFVIDDKIYQHVYHTQRYNGNQMHFYFNHQYGILSFQELDGTQWNLK